MFPRAVNKRSFTAARNSFRQINRFRGGTAAPLKRTYSSSSSSSSEKKPFLTNGQIAGYSSLILGGMAAGYFLTGQLNPEELSLSEGSTTKLESLSIPTYGDPHNTRLAFGEIIQVVGKDNVSTSASEIDLHTDSSWDSHRAEPGQSPGLVVFPESTEQISKIMKICHHYRVPVVPFAGGTSIEGNFIPVKRGISLDFRRMANVIAIHKDDLDVVVQPGVGWEDLNAQLIEQNLFFPPDPGPGAEIGGMIGTGCSGTNASRYGTMREWVLALTVVLADGTVIHTRQRPRKSSAGYNLNNLFVGSEGTLGIVTEAVLKVTSYPQQSSIAVCGFNNIEDATRTVQQIMQSGISPWAVELLDDKMMAYINKSGTTLKKWKEIPTLFFKFGGTSDDVAEQAKQVRGIAKQHHNVSFDFATGDEEKEELWSARKEALWSTQAAGNPGDEVWTTDVAVPLSRLEEIVSITKKDIVASGLIGSIVGHVGDGNFHSILVFPKEKRPMASALVHRMVKRALAMEGTCTGEHGVGMGKRAYLAEEMNQDTVDTMRRIKLSLDPLRLLNPEKIIAVDPRDDVIAESQ